MLHKIKYEEVNKYNRKHYIERCKYRCKYSDIYNYKDWGIKYEKER